MLNYVLTHLIYSLWSVFIDFMYMSLYVCMYVCMDVCMTLIIRLYNVEQP